MKPVLQAVTCVAIVLGCTPAYGQSVISARSGLVDLVDGAVFLGDKKIEVKSGNFPEVKENAVLRTTDGRAEILLNPGVFLRLGENSSMKMLKNRLIDSKIELLGGSAVIEAAEIGKDTSATIVSKGATVSLKKAGIYRFDSEPARLRVFAGEASVEVEGRTIQVGGGKMLAFEGENAAVLLKFNKDQTDSLDHWSRRRGEYVAMANVSAAKGMRDSGYSLYSGVWRFNPYFGMYTFIPAGGILMSPYGYRYWSPVTVGRIWYVPPPMSSSGWNSAASGGYQGMGGTSTGYSGTAASVNSGSYSSAPAAAASSGSAASSSAGSSAVGGGASGGGGGRGR
jgi:hypothetical protein